MSDQTTNNTPNIEEYFMTRALNDWNRSYIKNRDIATAERYFKCWVNDMFYILYDYGIHIETFLINLITKLQQHEKESI